MARAFMPEATLAGMAAQVHADNQHWWHNPATGERLNRNEGEMFMLMISEMSECMEGERKDLLDDHLPDRKMAEVELADGIIRILDYCGAKGIDLDDPYDQLPVWTSNKAEALCHICYELATAGQNISPHWTAWRIRRAFRMILRYAEMYGYDVWAAVAEKHEYNKHRADHKAAVRLAAGGKKF